MAVSGSFPGHLWAAFHGRLHPWLVLLLLGTQPAAVAAYRSAAGGAVLLAGMVASVVCYRVMLRIGALPREKRVFA